jgi:tRNA pseudouridine32 synthase/23S rRNA pseudouridine746 synthase
MLEIIYQDDYLLAINKPHGLLSVPGRGEDKQDCVVNRLLTIYPDVKVVHRLDCHTSGVMLLAMGIDIQRALSRLFHDRKIDKEYIAHVAGEVADQSGVIDIPMRGDPDNRPVQIVDYEHGKQAQTNWQLLGTEQLESGKMVSRLKLVPVTGRTHQLRLHCAMLGHPIIGDRLYNMDVELEKVKRMRLHARKLHLKHPVTDEELEIVCEPDF